MFPYTTYLLPIVAVLLAGNTSVNANPVVCRVDNTQPFGTNPINKPKVEYLGFHAADNSCSHRDLGFTGAIAGQWYALWGDVLWCDAGVTGAGKGHAWIPRHGDNGRQRQLVPFNSFWGEKFDTGFGGTSLVETNPDTATTAVFYLVNSAGLVGAGVAKVDVINGTPTPAHTNPRYGDIVAFRDPRSDFVYAWGGPPTTASGWVEGSSVYLVRVKASEAFDMSKYQYWWGLQQGWKSDRLTAFTSETATLWGAGQGIGGGFVFLRAASRPEGPWTPDVKIFQAEPIDGSLVYAGVAHPYLDESGKTPVVSFTNNNRIQVIKATFSQ
ncbi:hypothetical protein C8034_v008383 [Colletotrichum sidae]|uniref:DUF4185 domain-containing protein n=1 Tax=Colletotrichum sidae TaxID=1347389 RepID=A0A4V3I3M7_9PEZI|nr:hypothetical protein C8034_v008383 [Colletotrichum sidae]